MKLGEPTIDQLRIFLAVAEAGSFGGAARAMGRAVSVISYGVSQMEAQLDTVLFQREGSRKPQLTEAGWGLLPEARAIADRADALLAKARSLHAGLESEVSVVLDVMIPGEFAAKALRQFRDMFPTVSLRLNVEGLGAVASCVLDGSAQVGFAGPVVADHPELERHVVGEIELIPVAACDHPLAQGDVRPGESREHLQLVLSDRSNLTTGKEFAVLSPQTWRLGDLSAKHDLLRQGIGWGNMPTHLVERDIAQGRLAALDLPEKPGAGYALSACWRRDTRPGPATSWLIDALRENLGGA